MEITEEDENEKYGNKESDGRTGALDGPFPEWFCCKEKSEKEETLEDVLLLK